MKIETEKFKKRRIVMKNEGIHHCNPSNNELTVVSEHHPFHRKEEAWFHHS